MPTRRYVLAAGAAGLLSATAGLTARANAQAVKKPVHVIVGFPAGGGTNIIARILADRLRGTYASTVLVENKRGAGRKRHAVHAGLSNHGLSAQLPLAELRPVAGFYPGGAGGKVDADLQCRRRRAGEREDARRLRPMVQGKSGKGVVRDHRRRRHAAFRRRD